MIIKADLQLSFHICLFFAIYHLYYGGKIMTMTQMQSARAGKITDEMKIVAQEEKNGY